MKTTYLDSHATISDCGLYRYDLWRIWSAGQIAVFIGLNPSTADGLQDDATIRKCVSFAKGWGYGSLCMVNLFAFRATQPRDMLAAQDPVGPMNDGTLQLLSRSAGVVIAAWGNDGGHLGRDKQVMGMIQNLHCLKKNQNGSPAHPLYLPGTLKPTPYNA